MTATVTGRARGIGAAALWAALAAAPAWGIGTPAGTVITNSAEVTFTMLGVTRTQLSNPNTMVVDDKVSFVLTAADGADVPVTPGGSAVMSYRLTNTGNGSHDFALSAVVTGSPTLTPAAGPIFYSDPEGTSRLPDDRSVRLPYLPALAPDSSRMLYQGITAPAQQADRERVSYLVTAEAFQNGTLGSADPVRSSVKAATDARADKSSHPMTGYVLLADGHGNGLDADRDGRYAVIAKDGRGREIGFVARSATVQVVKSQKVTDRAGGEQPASGATVRYTLSVSAQGSGTALGVVLSDLIPQHTSYRSGTLTLNGSGLSDLADGDAGDVGGSAPGAVTVKLGDLSGGGEPQVISFEVGID